jgi:hypothetical protein
MPWYWTLLLIAAGWIAVVFLVACILRAGSRADEKMQKLLDDEQWNALLDERRSEMTKQLTKKG